MQTFLRTIFKKTGQKSSRLKFVGANGYDGQKKNNPVLNGTYCNPRLRKVQISPVPKFRKNCFLKQYVKP